MLVSFTLISWQILSTLHIFLCMALIKLLMFTRPWLHQGWQGRAGGLSSAQRPVPPDEMSAPRPAPPSALGLAWASRSQGPILPDPRTVLACLRISFQCSVPHEASHAWALCSARGACAHTQRSVSAHTRAAPAHNVVSDDVQQDHEWCCACVHTQVCILSSWHWSTRAAKLGESATLKAKHFIKLSLQ